MDLILKCLIILTGIATLIGYVYIKSRKIIAHKAELALKTEILNIIINDVDKINNVKGMSKYIPKKKMTRTEAYEYIREHYGAKMQEAGFMITPELYFKDAPQVPMHPNPPKPPMNKGEIIS